MKKLWQFYAYLNYRRKAKSRFKVHSTFVYELIENVFRDTKRYDDYRKLNRTRRRYRRRTDRLETMDFGAASKDKDYTIRVTTVGKIVRERTHSKKKLQFLYRMARYLKPGTILEFGTAAGISAMYFSKGSPESRMITMEGCMGLASVARKSFRKRKLNIEVEVGDFDAILDGILEKVKQLDMVFIDGNHRKEPTKRYFERCIKLAGENSVFMFDDIHWSRGMNKAWNSIKKDERVSITIDLFWIGLVFFKQDIAKQDFVLRY